MSRRFKPDTRGGQSVVIYDDAVECANGYSIHGRVHYPYKGRWLPQAWLGTGQAVGYYVTHPLDLVPIDEPEELMS